jgi:hypothetical protein
VPGFVVTASLKNIQKAVKVTLKIRVWVDDRVPHSGLGCEIHDTRKLVLCKQLVDMFLIGEIDLFKLKGRNFVEDVES